MKEGKGIKPQHKAIMKADYRMVRFFFRFFIIYLIVSISSSYLFDDEINIVKILVKSFVLALVFSGLKYIINKNNK